MKTHPLQELAFRILFKKTNKKNYTCKKHLKFSTNLSTTVD